MSTRKCKAHWHLCPWVWGVEVWKNGAEEKPWGNRVTKIQYWDGGGQRSWRKDQEWCKQFNFSYQSSTSLPLLRRLSCFRREDAGKVILSQQGYWFLKAITQSLLAIVSDGYTLINVIRMTMKESLLTFQRCCSDVSKSTWNNHQKESAQHRTYRWYLWRFAAGWASRGDLHHTFHLGNKLWQRQDYCWHFAHVKKIKVRYREVGWFFLLCAIFKSWWV